ncbi:MAG: VWA domain-containing protein [Acidobacteriota bacterium]|nr:VWA domain-containing protein [Acidobacteriota bacterium]
MYRGKHLKNLNYLPLAPKLVALIGLAVFAGALWIAIPTRAQSSSQDQSSSQSQPSQSQQGQMPAEAGGPTGESSTIAVPKKKETEEPPPPPRPKPSTTDNPQFSLHVDVPVVTVDARLINKDGSPIPLPIDVAREHFRILEDGVPQKIQTVTQSQAPITAVLLVEFASTNYNFMYDALNASYMFASNLQPKDWVAVIEFDMKTHILVDFTQDKQAIFGALNMLRVPGFRETNIFDAMYDTLDRLDRIPGPKELVVVASGRDTFSKITLDTILKKVKATPNVTIYTISTGAAFLNWVDARYGSNPNMSAAMMDYIQADNQMNTFARMTGGHWYKPRLEGELPDIFREVARSIRDQYTITYKPTNTKQDGTYRKLKVELVGPDDKPLEIKDQKNKDLKYTIVARDGYTAKHQVE